MDVWHIINFLLLLVCSLHAARSFDIAEDLSDDYDAMFIKTFKHNKKRPGIDNAKLFPFVDHESIFGKVKNLTKYLQPYDVLTGKYDYAEDDGIRCSRDCTKYPEPRICYYEFVAEQYHVLGPACKQCGNGTNSDCYLPQCVTADGIEKTILTINRQLPGPSIQVCYLDRIIVDVKNKMPARSLTIHAHGILQERSPWMDGVPYATQCPILDDSTFRYDYYADTIGTHFWHAHTGMHMLDGIQGSLIVRVSESIDPHSKLYDYDLFSHTIQVMDWLHLMGDNKYPGYNKVVPLVSLRADSYLINGRGVFQNSTYATNTPYETFLVKKGYNYRFRIITGNVLTCPAVLTFENHDMTLIATDSYPAEPVLIGSMSLVSSDIFDVIISANQEVGTYWIRLQGQDDCSNAYQLAVLKYEGSPDDVPKEPSQKYTFGQLTLPELNNVQYGCIEKNVSAICMDDLEAVYPASDELLKEEPDFRIFLSTRFHQYTLESLFYNNTFHRFYLPQSGPDLGGGMFCDLYNNISHVAPPFSLLTQDEEIPEDLICPSPEVCAKELCECLNLIKIRLYDVVEIVILDDTSSANVHFYHPHHIHGNAVRVLKQGSAEERKKPNFYKNVIRTKKPIMKTTIAVPGGGFAVVRFSANNAGIWAIHCHFALHHLTGMMAFLQVGNRTDFLKAPDDFPKCNDYKP